MKVVMTMAAGILGSVMTIAPAFAMTGSAATSSTSTQTSSTIPTTLKNLATTQNTSVQVDGPVDPYFEHIQNNHPGPSGGITEYSSTWTGYCRQMGRTIYTDIGSEEAISDISLTFDSNPSEGIYIPDQVTFSLSQNGEDWKSVTKNISAPTNNSGVVHVHLSIQPQIARYIKVTFPVAVWVFARNFQVSYNPALGIPKSEHLSLVPRDALVQPVVVNHFLSPWSQSTVGMSNIFLAYSGGPKQPVHSSWTTAKFVPMLGYINRTGTLAGHFFNSALFLPYGSVTTTSGWNHYVANLFAPNEQLAALNQATSQVDKKLRTPYMKTNVILSLPLPPSGSISPKGSRLKSETSAISTLLSNWSASNFPDLNLVGFYWDVESMSADQPRDVELVQHIGHTIEQDGLHFYWIPFFDANYFSDWKGMGISAAFLQPNYYELTNPSLVRLQEASNLAKKYGLGVEIEGGHDILLSPDKRNAYLNELTYFHNDQIQNDTVHAFYFGDQTLIHAANSTDPAIHALYRDTYRFVIGGYPYTPYLPTDVK